MVHERLKARGFYTVVCRDKNGAIKWTDRITNLVTVEGKNLLLDTMFNAATQLSWYFGLVSAASYTSGVNAADTMASHAGWAEDTSYSNATRPAASFGAASGGQVAIPSAVAFSINGTADLVGMFLCSDNVKAATAGVLYSAGAFDSGNQSVVSSDTLEVTYTALV